MKKLTAMIIALSILSMSCATSTTIRSKPEGAKVYVDEQYLGDTPVKYEDSGVFWTGADIELKKDGYQSLNAHLKKNKVRVLCLIGGLLCDIPFLWITGYPEEHNYELQELPQERTQAGLDK